MYHTAVTMTGLEVLAAYCVWDRKRGGATAAMSISDFHFSPAGNADVPWVDVEKIHDDLIWPLAL
jgi:hypothetical protein